MQVVEHRKRDLQECGYGSYGSGGWRRSRSACEGKEHRHDDHGFLKPVLDSGNDVEDEVMSEVGGSHHSCAVA